MNNNKQNTYYIDGQLLAANLATIPVNDLTFTRGYGAFESIRTYQRVPFLLEKHILRLLRTTRLLRLRHNYDAKYIFSKIKTTLSKNPDGEKLIRIYITAGDGKALIPLGKPRLLILVDDFSPPPEKHRLRGVSLMPYQHCRPTALAKSTNYTEAVLANTLAREKHYDEAVFVNKKGDLLEGTTFNILACTKKTWIIPLEETLPGITLQTVISLLRRKNHPIEFRNIKSTDLKKCLGLFITSSNREILPVSKVGDFILPLPSEGQLGFSLVQSYQCVVEKYTLKNKKLWK